MVRLVLYMFNQFIYAIAELDAYVDINSTVSEYNGHKSSDIFLNSHNWSLWMLSLNVKENKDNPAIADIS